MATAAERKALIFLAAVACLGAGARVARSRGDAALIAAAGRTGAHGAGQGTSALDAQIEAADAARAGTGSRNGARTSTSRSTSRSRRRVSADSTDRDTIPPRTRRSSSSRRPPADTAQPDDPWLRRPVVTHLTPGGFGVVQSNPPPIEDPPPPVRPRRRKRTAAKP